MAQVLVNTPIQAHSTLDSKHSYNVIETLIDTPQTTVDIDQISSEASNSAKTHMTPVQLTHGIDLTASRLISSPYPDLANQLHTPTLDTQSRLFAFALTALAATRPDYATAPYMESFNWPDVFSLLRALSQKSGLTRWQRQEFYVVTFRSKLQFDTDRGRLALLDQKSHEEACESGGLLKYWFGTPDAERRNLATCVWRNREDAYQGGRGPWHKQARAAARELYEHIDFHVHRLTIEDGAEGWSFEAYQ